MRNRPLSAIRKYCLWCMVGNRSLVKECEETDCPFHKFRNGKGEGKGSRLKAIRKRCLDCSGSSNEVEKCLCNENKGAIEKCSLWEYRKGKNPKRKGIGNSNPSKNIHFKKRNTELTDGFPEK